MDGVKPPAGPLSFLKRLSFFTLTVKLYYKVVPEYKLVQIYCSTDSVQGVNPIVFRRPVQCNFNMLGPIRNTDKQEFSGHSVTDNTIVPWYSPQLVKWYFEMSHFHCNRQVNMRTFHGVFARATHLTGVPLPKPSATSLTGLPIQVRTRA